MMANLKELAKKCMDSTLYCALATHENGGAWVAPVVFAYDRDFNLYFVSGPKTRHMKNISRNGKVSIAIYSTQQKITGPKIGVQLEGYAEWVKGPVNILKGYNLYFKRNVKWSGATLKYFRGNKVLAKVTTTRLFYFNNGLFGEERQKVK